jgi:hypothetical protein
MSWSGNTELTGQTVAHDKGGMYIRQYMERAPSMFSTATTSSRRGGITVFVEIETFYKAASSFESIVLADAGSFVIGTLDESYRLCMGVAPKAPPGAAQIPASDGCFQVLGRDGRSVKLHPYGKFKLVVHYHSDQSADIFLNGNHIASTANVGGLVGGTSRLSVGVTHTNEGTG